VGFLGWFLEVFCFGWGFGVGGGFGGGGGMKKDVVPHGIMLRPTLAFSPFSVAGDRSSQDVVLWGAARLSVPGFSRSFIK